MLRATYDDKNVDYDGERWVAPDGINIRENIEIFDINFVNENVFTNSKIEHKNKESLTSFILGERGVDLVKKLETLEKTLLEKEQKYKADKPKLEKALRDISYDEVKKQAYNENFKDFECLLIASNEEIQKLSKQLSEIDQIKSITKIGTISADYSTLRRLVALTKEICNFTCEIDLTKLKDNIESIKKETPNITDKWIKEGIKLSKDTCPLCGNTIINNERIKIFSDYFSDLIISFLDKVEKCQNEIIRNFKGHNTSSFLAKCTQQKNMIEPYFNGDKSLIESLTISLEKYL